MLFRSPEFELRPYSKGLARSLKKEGKLYLRDWSEVEAQGPRFENHLACHLLKACDFWTDTGEGNFELTYLRNKEKQEIDFLILRNGRPWMPVEAKLSDTTPAPHFGKFLSQLGCRRGLQVVASPNHFRKHVRDGLELLVISADEALAYFV